MTTMTTTFNPEPVEQVYFHYLGFRIEGYNWSYTYGWERLTAVLFDQAGENLLVYTHKQERPDRWPLGGEFSEIDRKSMTADVEDYLSAREMMNDLNGTWYEIKDEEA